MNASDVVVLPFRDILISGSAILAMSFGKPVITPAIGCTLDILKDVGNFLYDPSNNLFEVMRRVMNEHTRNLIKIGKRNFEISRQFQWVKIAKRTYEVYQECLS